MKKFAPNTVPLRVAVSVAVLLSSALSTVAIAQAPAPPEPPKTWTGTAGAGLALTSGNSQTTNYNLAFDVTRTPEARNVIKIGGLYLRGKQVDTLVVNRTSLGVRDEYRLSGRTFFFGQVDYLRDTFKLIDYLIAPTAGVGVKVVDTDTMTFAVDAGAGSVSEKNPGRDVRTSAALTAGEKFTLELTPTASLKHAATGLWKASDAADALYTFSIGLGTRISERTQLSVDLLDTFKQRPASAATKKNDVAFVTTITAKF